MKLSTKRTAKFVITAMTFAFVAIAALSQDRSLASSAPAGDGAETFKAKCAACHGADGAGTTAAGKAMKVRDLGSADVQALTDDQLFEIIAKGKGKMPSYEKSIGADKCKELVAYIRTFKK